MFKFISYHIEGPEYSQFYTLQLDGKSSILKVSFPSIAILTLRYADTIFIYESFNPLPIEFETFKNVPYRGPEDIVLNNNIFTLNSITTCSYS